MSSENRSDSALSVQVFIEVWAAVFRKAAVMASIRGIMIRFLNFGFSFSAVSERGTAQLCARSGYAKDAIGARQARGGRPMIRLRSACGILAAASVCLCAASCEKKDAAQNEPFAELKTFQCPQQTNRVDDKESSYPRYFCVGFDGKQGPYLEFDAHGRIKLAANYDKDKLNGTWTSYHPTGAVDTTGTMKDGKRVGQWTQYYVNGNMRSQKTYDNDIQNGDVALYYQAGGIMAKGAFVADLEQGLWQVYTPDGKLARECTMTDGKETDCNILIKDFQITTKSYNSGERGAL